MGAIYSTYQSDPLVRQTEAEEQIESADYWDRDLTLGQAAQVARAVREVGAAIDGDKIALQAVLSAVAMIRDLALWEVMDR